MRDDTTFNAFVDWLKTKPADETYNYISATNCAFSQFLGETGRAKQPSCCYEGWRDKSIIDGPRTPMDERLEPYNPEPTYPLQAGTFGGILADLKENGHVA